MMKFSILSPSYNQAPFIEQNIQSVLSQTGVQVEHIVIDGGSNDGTTQLLESYGHLRWISEKDNGQADALNKGLAMASGDIVGWINSDDAYESDILKQVATYFSDPNVKWVVGNLIYMFDATGERIAETSPVITYDRLVANPDILRQQPTFFRRSELQAIGGWNVDLHMTMDYDLWLRLARRSTPIMTNQQWAYFRFHADQKTSLSNFRRQRDELMTLMRHENATFRDLLKIHFVKDKLICKQFIKELLIKYGFVDSKFRSRPMRLPARGP